MGANIDKNRMSSKENDFLTAFRKKFYTEKDLISLLFVYLRDFKSVKFYYYGKFIGKSNQKDDYFK